MDTLLNRLGCHLARFLSKTDEESQSIATCSREKLMAALQPGDVLLIDGNSRISMAIKYITQSTWSHAAIFIGKSPPEINAPTLNHKPLLIEADITEGVRMVPLTMYCHMLPYAHSNLSTRRTFYY